MGSLRGIRTTVRAEEKAVDECKDRQWEQDYQEWTNDPERFYQEQYYPACFGSCDPYDLPYPYYCQYECGRMDACQMLYMCRLRESNSPDDMYEQWPEEETQD